MKNRKRYLDCANGIKKADLVLKKGKVFNVFTNEMIECDVAICDDTIVGVGEYEGVKEIDCKDQFLVPGFIDAHMHIESCMVAPGELSKVLVKAGTTTIIADPHEIVNVSGSDGLDYFLDCIDNMLVNTYFMVPSAVPASDFETNGCGEFLAEEMKKYVENPHILGLGETMCFRECLQGEKRMSDKIELFSNKHIDGHAPGLFGKEVQAYRLSGVENDHECSMAQEVLDKLRAGFYIFIREGSGAKNLDTLVKTLLAYDVSFDDCAFCTDDKHVEEIITDGHISTCIRKAIALGVPITKAYKMGSYQTAKIYGLKDLGAIGAGYKADIVFLDNLEEVRPISVMKSGKILTEEDYKRDLTTEVPKQLLSTVHTINLRLDRLAFACDKKTDVIAMNRFSLETTHIVEEVPRENGFFVPNSIYNKICVVERHGKTGEIGVAPIKGFGIQSGAIATSVAHDSHNIIVAGDNDEDILLAIKTVQEIQGGYVIVSKGQVMDTLPLRIGGLMSEQPYEDVTARLSSMLQHARELGVSKDIDPFITLSFMALTVIPQIRITERGLVICH